MRAIVALLIAVSLGGCLAPVPTGGSGGPLVNAPPPKVSRNDARAFAEVVSRVEPAAERLCRQRQPRANCDYRIVVDTRPGQPANAYQSVTRGGRPVITFTLALIAETRNADELAFVMGHEAAHHIAGHLEKTRTNAMTGAALGGLLAVLAGTDPSMLDTATNIGATVGARRYSKDFELQADRLGTIIAYRAGYDPLRGAAYFNRIPDPGNQFLGTHPPNRDRIRTVRRTMAGLG